MYGLVDITTWNDRKFRALSAPEPCAQVLWLYLLAPRERCLIPGLIPAGVGTIAESLRWSYEATREVWGEIAAQGMAEFDPAGPLIWLPNALSHNRPRNQHQVTGWGKAWAEIPDCPLKHRAWEGMRQFIAALGEQFAAAFQASFPEPSPTQSGGTVPPTVRGKRPRNRPKVSTPVSVADGPVDGPRDEPSDGPPDSGGPHDHDHEQDQEAAAAARERAREAAPEAPLPPPALAPEACGDGKLQAPDPGATLPAQAAEVQPPAPAASAAPEAPKPTAPATAPTTSTPPASATGEAPTVPHPTDGRPWWHAQHPEVAAFLAAVEAAAGHKIAAPKNQDEFSALSAVLRQAGVERASMWCAGKVRDREARSGRILSVMYFLRGAGGPGMLAELLAHPEAQVVELPPRKRAGTVGPGCAPIVETLRERARGDLWDRYFADASWWLDAAELVVALGPSCPAPELIREQRTEELLEAAQQVVGADVVRSIRIEAQEPRQAAGGGA